MQLTRLIYASNHGGIKKEALDDILEESRRNNIRDDITGLLISSDEDFIQLIEGGRTVISNCFMRIMQDTRHRYINVLLTQGVDSRLFPKWSMRNVDVTNLKKDIIDKYWSKGAFDSQEMAHADIEALFLRFSDVR
ncbi:BLUF domain-containing protein [Paracoccus haeundaensis]|uniref:BLUF domain-containing protein n=1 Tax=Paracoccus haeundaensis TaxID=225362 RepID=A0A5C4R1E2_9RHOB|nr:BLUF domain-containing protein [Paracoccus haeundaensis]TNH37782.1 BLUF domain-containing protein [Paracoccus haeundaensis]